MRRIGRIAGLARCLFGTDVKTIGTSLNGAIRRRIASANSFIVLLSFSIRSHLLTTITHPFLLRTTRLKIFRSCASIPAVASSIKMQTSDDSIERIERSTE